jgi:hypothetical protein
MSKFSVCPSRMVSSPGKQSLLPLSAWANRYFRIIEWKSLNAFAPCKDQGYV